MEIYKVLQKEFYGDDTRWFLGIVKQEGFTEISAAAIAGASYAP